MADNDQPIVPFRQFVDSIASARYDNYRTKAETRVTSVEAFEEMKQHVLRLYEGVEALHSFVDESGQDFDCIPYEQQPSVRGTGQTTPPAPPTPPQQGSGYDAQRPTVSLDPRASGDQKDRFGNAMTCPVGTIPMRRVTLDELSRFETLRQFFRKGPRAAGGHPLLKDLETEALEEHKYAHAFQAADNLGGHSFLNIWQPRIGPNQTFSLSQIWISAGSGTRLQTVECGWQVFPSKYNTPLPCLFVYWTADGYDKSGCYNLDCRGFSQTSNAYRLGGGFSPVSVTGGAQMEIELSWFLTEGRWWLFVAGIDAAHALGFYPISQFGSGQLPFGGAQVDFGGETVGAGTWPPMGSGQFANGGFQRAAYQRNIRFYPNTGGVLAASLTPDQPSSSCYTINNFVNDPNWGSYFFFGGPGGTTC